MNRNIEGDKNFFFNDELKEFRVYNLNELSEFIYYPKYPMKYISAPLDLKLDIQYLRDKIYSSMQIPMSMIGKVT